jgi:predicted permease
MRSLGRLTAVDLGFEPDHLLVGTARIQGADHPSEEQRVLFFSSLLEEIRAQPGVESAALASKLPIRDGGQDWPIWRAEDPRPSRDQSFFAMARFVSPDYFGTMGIPLVQGRDVSSEDTPGAPLVVLLSEQAAQGLFPDQEAVGRSVKLGWTEDPYRVIGVVADARLNRLRDQPVAAFYGAAAQMEATGIMEATMLQIAVRTTGNPESLVGAVDALLHRMDPNALLAGSGTMQSVVDGALGDLRIVILSLSLFAGVALLLTAIGLYGILAYQVQQRTRELAVRLALGAPREKILGLVLGRGMLLVGGGLLAGLLGAWAATRLLERLLFETRPLDPAAYAGALLFLLGVALLACLLPAWRASRVNLVTALRCE